MADKEDKPDGKGWLEMPSDNSDGQIVKNGSIEIKNLIISETPMRRIALGDKDGLKQAITNMRNNIQGILWSEDEITLILENTNIDIRFVPELHPASILFFEREEKKSYNKGDPIRVWEGEYSPVKFSKTDLLKFLRRYSTYFDPKIQDSIKNLRVSEKKSEQQISLSDDSDENYRNTEENIQDTNLPSTFKAKMPLFDGITAELEFEARIMAATDRYGEEKKGPKQIRMRCLNARDAIRSAMKEVLDELPKDIPRFYGKMNTPKE